MKNEIDLSIIIVSFNTKKIIDNCLNSIFQSLKNSKFTSETIVIDNGSIDGSVDLIKQKYPQVRLNSNKTNLGFGKANNQGTLISKGNYLLFLNSDTVVINCAIDKLYDFTKSNNGKMICGGKLFNLDMSPQPSCGPQYSLINIFIALFLKGDYFGLTRYSPNKITNVDWIMGACMMMSKNLFNTVGGFDEGIFMYMEEIDFEYRARMLKFNIQFFPDAHFIHLGAASGEGRNRAILNVFKGFKYYYKKHFGFWKNILLNLILISKSLISILLFTIIINNSKKKLYLEALKISVSK
ncbi:MAG: hypothetical protein UR52_C0001G0003 [Candidatus Gottesmanbacteria bacterium GW2011_GWA1_34_13]|uniref:Glycosyltransferase 2-like domain-containing protein n=1 Tax=Candidatus Gottesmanbacteria bacterium GW2011_GWA1_34_13 TaxID=1618434 RepID=A0A0G0AS96_9BACT|nr:MAG: hypothetical protein UR52_C0001G0003 [Candidatus Gottesmanbacteria bacterium GW2011_GWA1_34_13]